MQDVNLDVDSCNRVFKPEIKGFMIEVVSNNKLAEYYACNSVIVMNQWPDVL